MTKSDLRQSYRSRRAAIPAAERAARSRALMAGVLALPRVQSARTVLAYDAVGSEVATRPLLETLWQSGRAVALPCLRPDGGMDMLLVRSPADLEPGEHGIPRPKAPVCPPWRPDPSDVVLVPGVAFTRDGLRLGQGGGYYDRFLAEYPGLWAIGLAFTEQVAESLPCEAHDIHLRQVVVG